MAACMATALAAPLATLAPSEVSLPSDRPDPETPANDGAAARAGPLLLGMHPSLAPQGVRVRGPTVEGIAEAVLLADLPLMEQRWVREMAYYHGQMASVRDGHEYFPGHV